MTQETKSYTVEVQENKETDEYFIQLPEEILTNLKWNTGDTVIWNDNKDGSFTLTKKETNTEWVLVETVTMFKHRYLVEVPKGKDEWALDTVVCDDAKEFSQTYLDQNLFSHRVITKEDAMQLCKEDNDYCSTWSEEQLLNAFFTPYVE